MKGVLIILSRSEAVLRLLKIRREINEKSGQNKEIKTKLDQLLIDLIGAPPDGEDQINDILNKAIAGKIKTRTAIVAIHEIMHDYEQKDNKQKTDQLTQLYEKGYR